MKNTPPATACLEEQEHIAGPDDPIYQSGLTVVPFRRQTWLIGTKDQKAIVERMRRDPKYKQD